MNAYLDKTDRFMASLGLDTYRVGGSVRDEILGRRVKDADYAIFGASLDEVKRRLMYPTRFTENDLTGRQTRVKITPLKLRSGDQAGWRYAATGLGVLEISLGRTEKSTGSGRQDFEFYVGPEVTMEEDAQRRDFTFNALYRDVSQPSEENDQAGGIVDPTGSGLTDLQHKIIQTTHPDSFERDPLRMLRALRFISTLGYELSETTRLQMAHYRLAAHGLTQKGVSGTVYEELTKLLMGDNPADALRVARDTGVLGIVLPELQDMVGFEQGSKYHDMTTDEHTFAALDRAAHVGAPARVRLALLFHDSGKPESAFIGKDGMKHYYGDAEHEDHAITGSRRWRKAARRLNIGNTMRHDVDQLILRHMLWHPLSPKVSKVNRWRVELGDELFRDLLMHKACDIGGKFNASLKGHLADVEAIESLRAEAERHGVPAGLKDLEITGNDAKDTMLRGAEIGAALREVLDQVICQPDEQTMSREWQLKRLQAYAHEVVPQDRLVWPFR